MLEVANSEVNFGKGVEGVFLELVGNEVVVILTGALQPQFLHLLGLPEQTEELLYLNMAL